MHYAEVNIPMELGAEISIRCRSPQVGAEVIPSRSRLPRPDLGPDQEQQNFENLGPIETGQSSDMAARGSPMYSINSNSHDRKS